mgnify:CR=1 FL=1
MREVKFFKEGKVVVGLTGGIGSGKSTVSRILQKKGYPLIDLDKISHEVIEYPEVIEKLVKAFGEDILDENGKISRRKLGAVVFGNGNKEKLREINSIMHPVILAEMRRQVRLLEKINKIVFVEIQLLFEVKWEKEFDVILLVYADRETQIKRVMERDGRTFEEVEKIINSQINLEEKKKKSDYVIDNTKKIEEVELEIEKILEELEV